MNPSIAPDRNQSHSTENSGGSWRFHECGQLVKPPREHPEFEDLLADLAVALARVPPAEVDVQVEESLQRVAEFLDVDRSSLAECEDDRPSLLVTHSYEKAGIPPMPRSIFNDQFPWYVARILRGDVLRFDRLPEDLPAEAFQEREYVASTGMKSHVMIPFKVAGSIQGAIGVASFSAYRVWSDGLVRRLRAVGQVLANALARKRADLTLRQSEQRYRELVETTHAVPWEADAHTYQVRYVGPQGARLLGYPLEDWYRDGFWVARLHPDDRERIVRTMADVVRQGKDQELEYRMVSAAGREVWVHNVVTPARTDGVTPTVRGVLIDVTARKAAEEEALRLRDQLARVARVATMGELAATITHEVYQPLCAIVSNAQALQRFLTGGATDPAEVNETLLDIVRDGQRASEVIGRIRSLLRKGQHARAPFDLNDAIREVVALTRYQLTRKDIVPSLDLESPLPPVFGDRVQFQQVVLNLVLNAVDALDQVAAGTRRLSLRSARDEGGTIVVSVRDSGPGIAPEHLDHVFDALFTTKPDGMGIGLAISRSIIEAHGGRIWADSNAAGAVFHFTLPLPEDVTS